MKKLGQVGKYNMCKAISTVLTVGTPIITLACQSDFFVHNSGTAISATGVFAILIACLFLKDKIAENFKVTSAFVISTAVFILILLVERIMQPMKIVCIASMVASGIDELTFKRFYKRFEALMPKEAEAYKFIGFVFTTTKTLTGETENTETTQKAEEGEVNEQEQTD